MGQRGDELLFGVEQHVGGDGSRVATGGGGARGDGRQLIDPRLSPCESRGSWPGATSNPDLWRSIVIWNRNCSDTNLLRSLIIQIEFKEGSNRIGVRRGSKAAGRVQKSACRRGKWLVTIFIIDALSSLSYYIYKLSTLPYHAGIQLLPVTRGLGSLGLLERLGCDPGPPASSLEICMGYTYRPNTEQSLTNILQILQC